jgi:hypothetical protein
MYQLYLHIIVASKRFLKSEFFLMNNIMQGILMSGIASNHDIVSCLFVPTDCWFFAVEKVGYRTT